MPDVLSSKSTGKREKNYLAPLNSEPNFGKKANSDDLIMAFPKPGQASKMISC